MGNGSALRRGGCLDGGHRLVPLQDASLTDMGEDAHVRR